MSKIGEIGNYINHKNNDDYEDINFLDSITSYREKPLERFANVAFWAMTLGASVALASSLFIINPIILAGTFFAVSTVVGGTTLAATSKAEKLTQEIDNNNIDINRKLELAKEFDMLDAKYLMSNLGIFETTALTAIASCILPHTITFLAVSLAVSSVVSLATVNYLDKGSEEIANKEIIKVKKSLEPELQQTPSQIKSQETPVIENPLFEEGKGKDILAKQQEKELVNAGNSR